MKRTPWRAVDHEGEVLEILVQRRRDKCAAVKLMRKLLRKQGFAPKTVTTDKLRSYGAAFQHLGLSCHHEQGLRQNNGPRTAIKRYGGVSARCSALSQPDRPSDSSASTPPPTTILTFNATWSLDRRFGSSGQKQPCNGAVQPQRHNPRHNETTITADAAQLDKAAKVVPQRLSRSEDVVHYYNAGYGPTLPFEFLEPTCKIGLARSHTV